MNRNRIKKAGFHTVGERPNPKGAWRLIKQRDTKKERHFCALCALLGNPAEAAVRAGYPADSAARTAAELLQHASLRNRIERQKQALRDADLSGTAIQGLHRLALGPCNDAALLLRDEELSAEQIAGLDLFCVSEIRRPRGGGVEVRFFDRLAALRALLDYAGQARAEGASSSFYDALVDSARLLSGEAGD